MKLNGAQIVVECLREQGVEMLFGYPGAATINIHDELYKSEIKQIITSHEQGATHAADAYYRSSKKTGVCLATSGPGATNLVTGIATAYMDSVAMVAITGNVSMAMIAKDSFQEADILGMTMPVTKHNYMVKDINDLADIIREAFYIAESGRPGPVLIDIPKNLTVEFAEYEKVEKRPVQHKEVTITDDILKMIKEAKRPMIYAGGGVYRSGSSEEVLELSKKLNAPISTGLMAISTIPTDYELYLGMVGMHGQMVSNKAFNMCDLLICTGVRFSDRVVGKKDEFAKKAKIIQFDIDPAEINKNILVDGHILGDLKLALKELNQKVVEKQNPAWIAEIDALKEEHKYIYDKEVLNVPYLINQISTLADEDAMVSTDVGQHQMWTAQHFIMKSGTTFLTSGGLGTMGYGLGAAIGARFANPNRQMIMITGDGSFRMNFNEVITATRHKLPIKIFIMNNQTLGMVRQWQDLFYDQRFAATDINDDIDYELFAKSMKAKGYTFRSIEDMNEQLEEILTNNEVCIINCIVNTSGIVYPMVPPGKAIDQAIYK